MKATPSNSKKLKSATTGQMAQYFILKKIQLGLEVNDDDMKVKLENYSNEVGLEVNFTMDAGQLQ